MNEVNTSSHYYTQFATGLLIAFVACALGGCWEEIEYTGPPPESPSAVAKTSDDTAEPAADSFADDVAASLAPDESTSPPAAADLADTPPLPEITVSTPDSAIDSLPSEYEPADAADEPIFDEPPQPSNIQASATEPSPAAATPTAISPSTAKPTDQRRRNTRRMAWLLGSKLSLAALANDRGRPAADVAKWFGDSQTLAQLLGTTALPALPNQDLNASSATDPDRSLEYLFTQGQQIGRELSARRGDNHAALFEMAVKSNILLALYRPGAPVVDALAEAIAQSARRAELPAELWQPLLDTLAANASQTLVRDAVFDLHSQVDHYLSTTP